MKQRKRRKQQKDLEMRFRNSDAQRFLDITKRRREEERDIREMDRSFDEVDEFEFLTAGI